MRQGSRAARSPPGSGRASRCASRVKPVKHFTAPGFAVSAETHAVKRDAAGRTCDAVFRHHSADMGPVMLHGVGRDPALKLNPVGETRGEEVRMQVMRHQFGRDFKHRFEMLHRKLERLTGACVPEVADNASLPRVRQAVTLSPGPVARTEGESKASGTASGV